jgi:hypothetical protein
MAIRLLRWGRPRTVARKRTAPDSWEAFWAYRVDKTHSHPRGADLSYGIRGTSTAVTVNEVADLLVTETRAAHSYYPGEITVFVWRLYDLADNGRRPRATGPVPPDARVTVHP